MKIEIYTLDYCPYCNNALAFLKENNLQYDQTRVDDDIDGWSVKVGNMYGIKPQDVTFPQIIVDGERIGGYTDMMELHSQGKFLKA